MVRDPVTVHGAGVRLWQSGTCVSCPPRTQGTGGARSVCSHTCRSHLTSRLWQWPPSLPGFLISNFVEGKHHNSSCSSFSWRSEQTRAELELSLSILNSWPINTRGQLNLMRYEVNINTSPVKSNVVLFLKDSKIFDVRDLYSITKLSD